MFKQMFRKAKNCLTNVQTLLKMFNNIQNNLEVFKIV